MDRGAQVRKLHAFVQDKYPNAEYLETVVVSRQLVEQLEAVADEAVAQGSWFEVIARPAKLFAYRYNLPG